MPAVFFYISGHGYGHAVRQIEVANRLGSARPDLEIVIRTAASKRLFDLTLDVPATFIDGVCDTGVVQIDSLRLDEASSVARAAAFYEALPARIVAETDLLRRHDARFVVSDAPPLATAAARSAGVPSAVLSNFTWDWIYAAYAEALASAPGLLPLIRDAYAGAEGWRLPMHGGFESFRTCRDLPFIARRGHRQFTAVDVRGLLGLPTDTRLALVSFGGYGVDGLPLERLDCGDAFDIVAVAPPEELPPPVPGVHAVAEEAIYARGLRYEDLVRAVDVVITKPGYGIISDCVAGDTALLYTSRGHFAEYDVLVAEMPKVLRCAYVDQESLRAGRWRTPLLNAVTAPAPPERPRLDGADVAVTLITGYLEPAAASCPCQP